MCEKIIQLIEYKDDLLALTDKGEIYVWDDPFTGYEKHWTQYEYISLESSKRYAERARKELNELYTKKQQKNDTPAD